MMRAACLRRYKARRIYLTPRGGRALHAGGGRDGVRLALVLGHASELGYKCVLFRLQERGVALAWRLGLRSIHQDREPKAGILHMWLTTLETSLLKKCDISDLFEYVLEHA